MKRLTPEEVLFIHYRIMEETGGAHGVRDTKLLEASIARPFATFGKKDLYPDIFRKAAALMHSIIRNHPFIDGNKRTAVTSASIFLLLNGYRLDVTNKELERFTMKAAEGNVKLAEIARWFNKNSVKARP